MTTYDFVHLALLAVGGEIRGKTKLQKTVYFLGKLTSNLDALGYGPHYYGPYSSEVATAADRLRSLGFVDCSVAGGGAVDSRGFEVTRSDYRLNAEGLRVAKSKAERNTELWAALKEAANLLKGAGDADYRMLSVAAKTDFMLEERGTASPQELSAMADSFGWKVDPKQVSEAGKFLQQLNLVKLKQ